MFLPLQVGLWHVIVAFPGYTDAFSGGRGDKYPSYNTRGYFDILLTKPPAANIKLKFKLYFLEIMPMHELI